MNKSQCCDADVKIVSEENVWNCVCTDCGQLLPSRGPKDYEDERDFLDKLRRFVDQKMTEFFDSYNIDRGYFDFKLIVSILDNSFQKMEEVTLMDESKNYCSFCREPSNFLVDDIVYCAECWHKRRVSNER